MYIQERRYGLGSPILQLPGIVDGVMGPLLQYYYGNATYIISVMKLY